MSASAEAFDSVVDSAATSFDESVFVATPPTQGLDARRRLEEKIEEMRLRREMQEFDFDL